MTQLRPISLLTWSRLRLSGKFPMGLRMPPLRIKIVLESNPLKSPMLVWGLCTLHQLVSSSALPY